MPDKIKKSLQEKYDRLKKALKKALSPEKETTLPQLILQPYKNRQRFEPIIASTCYTRRVPLREISPFSKGLFCFEDYCCQLFSVC